MSWRHRDILEGELHEAKGFTTANNGDSIWRNEEGLSEWTDREVLPAALNFVDASVAPPTTVSGDIYVLSLGASIHANWGTVALRDWVRYDGSSWNVITPSKSILCYDKTLDVLMSYDGSVWSSIGGGASGEVNTSSNSGAGEGLALTKVGSDLPFKSITAGTGITLTSSASELEISSSGGGGDNIANANLTFDGSYYADLSSFSWTLGGTAPIGTEKISLQKDTLIKGSNTSESTTGFKITDSNNSNLLDIRNNGQIGYGGTYLSTAGHTFRNPNDEAAIAKFLNNDATLSVEILRNGGFNSYRPGTTNTIFSLYYQGGVPHFTMTDNTNNLFIKFRTGSGSFMNVSGFAIGQALVPNSKALFQLYPPSTNSYQQKFFANMAMTSAGRVNSGLSFGTAEKGFECFDTTLNKKFVWTGSAWEKITSV